VVGALDPGDDGQAQLLAAGPALAVRDVLLEHSEKRRGAAQELVFLLQHPVLPACSADSPLVMLGRTPSSMSASLSQRCEQDSEIPESLAICDGDASPLRPTAAHVAAELQGESLRRAEHPSCEDESSRARSQLNSGQSRPGERK